MYSKDYTKLDRFLDYEQLEEWRIKITELIHSEVQTYLGGDYSKIMIGGFSQGAAVALYVASTLKNCSNEVTNCQGSCQIELCNPVEIKNAIDFKENTDQEQSSKQNLEVDPSIDVENSNVVDHNKLIKPKDTNVGCVIYCSGLHLFKNPENEIYKLNKFPIFVYHGVYDDMIDWDYSIRPFLRMSDKHPEIEVNTENMRHGFCDNEWEQMKKFIEKVTTPSIDH